MQTAPDFFTDPINYLQVHWDFWFPYVLLVVQIIILFIIYKVVVTVAKRSLISVGMGSEISSGITIVLRLIFFIMLLTLLASFLEPSIGALLSLTAIFGTALGLAFSQALSNIVSGFYVLASRPFRVGDYVRIGNVEGVIQEITLNYTRIILQDETNQLVPNSKVVSQEVTNYRIDVSEFLIRRSQAADITEEENLTYREQFVKAWNELKEIADDDDAYRYTFDLTVHMSHDHIKLTQKFDEVCELWSSKFVAKPTYIIWKKPSAAVTYRFAFIVKDSMDIIRYRFNLMKDLLSHHYE